MVILISFIIKDARPWTGFQLVYYIGLLQTCIYICNWPPAEDEVVGLSLA